MQQQNVNLLNALAQQQSIEAGGANEAEQRRNEYERSFGFAGSTAIAAVEWSVNQSRRYSFGELPLGNTRLSLLKGLVQHLLDMGFSGQIVVETHVGNFCMIGGGSDGYDLAPSNRTVEHCQQIGFEPVAAYEMGLQQSVAFANFANTVSAETGGKIQISIFSRGNDEPLIPYPIVTPDITADFWNEIAAQNNRVEISIDPVDR